MSVRCYLPRVLAPAALGEPIAEPGDTVFAVLPAERGAGGEDEEIAEFTAFSLAAATAAELAADAGAAPRLVLSADAAEADLEHLGEQLYRLRSALDGHAVVCGHVDEEATLERVAAADDRSGALEAYDEADLLWFDAAELKVLAAEA